MEFLTISDLENREISKKKPIALGGVVSKLHGPTQIGDYDWRLVVELVQYSQDPLPSIKKVTLRLWAHNAKKAKQGEWSIPSGNLETLPKCRPGDILLAYPVLAKELDDDSLVFEIGAQITRDRAFFVFSSETIRASNFSPKITDIIPSASSAKNSFEDENKTALKKIIETAINTHLSKISSDFKQLYDQESFISDRSGQYQGKD